MLCLVVHQRAAGLFKSTCLLLYSLSVPIQGNNRIQVTHFKALAPVRKMGLYSILTLHMQDGRPVVIYIV